MKRVYSKWNLDPERIALKEANDCTVQSLASGLQIPYEAAHDILKKGGRENRKGFAFAPFLERLKLPGMEFRKIDSDKLRWKDSNPDVIARRMDRYGYIGRHSDVGFIDKRVSISMFAKDHPKGTFFLISSEHVQVLIDGTLIDSHPSPRAKVILAYELISS